MKAGAAAADGPQVVLAWILLDSRRREDLLRFEAALAGVEELRAALLVAGTYDYLLVLATPDIARYQEILDRLLAMELGIVSHASTFVVGEAALGDGHLLERLVGETAAGHAGPQP